MDWLDLLAVQGTLKSLLQHHSSKASNLQCSAFIMVQLSYPCYWKNHSFEYMDLCWQSEGFPDSSVGKESAGNAGDPSSIPGSGRSPGEGIAYKFQYSCISLVAQTVKNPPAMWKTWV